MELLTGRVFVERKDGKGLWYGRFGVGIQMWVILRAVFDVDPTLFVGY